MRSWLHRGWNAATLWGIDTPELQGSITMIRRRILAATSALAVLALAAPPLAAQDAEAEAAQVDPAGEPAPVEEFVFLTEEEEERAKLEKEMTDAFAVFGELFKTDPLTPEQEARLPLAQQMALHMMPEGSFGAAMQQTIEPVMTVMMSELGSDPRSRLAEISGVESDHLAGLADETAQEALDIFDPDHAARLERMSGIMLGMVTKLMTAVEPAYREATAQSLATRFDEVEMRELLGFFATPLGGKFARESFTIQYDPRMAGVVEAMGPAMIQIIPEMTEEIKAAESDFAKARDFTELSKIERERAARLIGKSVNELEALVPETPAEGDDSESADPVA